MDVDTRNIPQKQLRTVLDKVREKIRKHHIVKELFEQYDVDISELDIIPMCFAKMDVSARTEHGVIYFNIKLLDDGDFENDDHYMVHEITHYLQQTTGTKPTKGADSGDYLENDEEIEGFQNQTKYLAETRDEETAEKYVNQVLDHHGVEGKDRDNKEDELLAKAMVMQTMMRIQKLTAME